MAGFYIMKEGQEYPWHVGSQKPPGLIIHNLKRIQANGDELTFAREALGLDPLNHHPRVQSFEGVDAQKIIEAMGVDPKRTPLETFIIEELSSCPSCTPDEIAERVTKRVDEFMAGAAEVDLGIGERASDLLY